MSQTFANEKHEDGYSERRLNNLARQLKLSTYVEIGVSAGVTFNSVDVPYKYGVDPNFVFDTAPFSTDDIKFFWMYSDNFFSNIKKPNSFDLFFIDGLHTFPQVLRDFCNALTFSHEKTVFLIDDVMPNDVYSSFPDQADTAYFRSEAGIADQSWHGDVYKLIFFIHDFYPSLCYNTISGSGNSQTLIWKSTEFGRSPRFNDLESINRLNFFDIKRNIDIFQESTEEEAIARCVASLREKS